MYKMYRLEIITGNAVLAKFDVPRAVAAVEHFFSYQDEVDGGFIDEVKLYSSEGRGIDGHPNPYVLRNSYTAVGGLRRHSTRAALVRIFTSHHKKKDLTDGEN